MSNTPNNTAPIGENDKWDFYEDGKQEWRWRRTAPNGNIVGAATQGYSKRADAEANASRAGFIPGKSHALVNGEPPALGDHLSVPIERPIHTSSEKDRWEFYQDKAGEWRWRRHSINGHIVGASAQGYVNRSDAEENAIRAGYISGVSALFGVEETPHHAPHKEAPHHTHAPVTHAHTPVAPAPAPKKEAPPAPEPEPKKETPPPAPEPAKPVLAPRPATSSPDTKPTFKPATPVAPVPAHTPERPAPPPAPKPVPVLRTAAPLPPPPTAAQLPPVQLDDDDGKVPLFAGLIDTVALIAAIVFCVLLWNIFQTLNGSGWF